jgi:hypothetical protein
VFEAPTPAALAAVVDGLLGARDAPEAAGDAVAPPPIAATHSSETSPALAGQGTTIMRRKDLSTCPLSFGQERLWILDRLQPGSAAYIIPAALRVPGAIQVPALERAINEVARRHEVLRATIRNVDGVPVQEIRPQLHVPLAVIDLSDLAGAEREERAQHLVAEEAARPFDVATGPLLRSTLIRLSETDHVLIIAVHHIVSDAWSMAVLFRELFDIYECFALNLPSRLPDLPLQYADFAAWQREHVSGERMQRLIYYWRGKLAGAPPLLNLPTDRPRPDVQVAQGARQQFRLSPALSRKIAALGVANRTTPFMTLLAAFNCVLYAYTGQADLVVGTPIANRGHTEIEGLIGFFANTVVLRSDLSNNPTFSELLARIRDVTLEAYAHQELPFEKLVDALSVRRSPSYNPVFQVLFNLQGAVSPAETMPAVEHDETRIYPGSPKFDLELALAETAYGIQGLLEYNTALFDHATMTALRDDFRSVLEDAVGDPQIRLEALSIFAASEDAGKDAALADHVTFSFESNV